MVDTAVVTDKNRFLFIGLFLSFFLSFFWLLLLFFFPMLPFLLLTGASADYWLGRCIDRRCSSRCFERVWWTEDVICALLIIYHSLPPIWSMFNWVSQSSPNPSAPPKCQWRLPRHFEVLPPQLFHGAGPRRCSPSALSPRSGVSAGAKVIQSSALPHIIINAI